MKPHFFAHRKSNIYIYSLTLLKPVVAVITNKICDQSILKSENGTIILNYLLHLHNVTHCYILIREYNTEKPIFLSFPFLSPIDM